MTRARASQILLVTLAVLTAFRHEPARAQDPPNAALDREEATRIVARMLQIATDEGVDRLETVHIGGIDQWVSIRAADRRNPVLLFLAGGPGGSAMASNWGVARAWEDYFTVVHWDQRGAGKTYAANDPEKVAPTLTLERMVQDTEELVAWLRQDLGKERIFLLGMSWGSYLGVEVARRRPEWLHAYVGLGQITDTWESEKLGWRVALNRARADGNDAAVSELESIAPFPGDAPPIDLAKVRTQRKWLSHYGGVLHGRPDAFVLFRELVKLSPSYSQTDIEAWAAGGLFSNPLAQALLDDVDLTKVRRLDCPVILFNGRHDYVTPSRSSAEWLERLEAPHKELVWFEHSAHVVTLEEPGKVLVELVQRVRPLAQRAGDAAP